MIRGSFLGRLYLGYVALIIFTVLSIGGLMARRIEDSSIREMQRSLETVALVLQEWARPVLIDVASKSTGAADDLRMRMDRLTQPHETRLTVILPDGVVLADTHQDPAVMQNHAQRPEIVEARNRGRGSSTRVSPSIDVNMMYLAFQVRGRVAPDQPEVILGYVRSALPMDTVALRMRGLREAIVVSTLSASVLALLLGFVLARRFTRPLREIISSTRAISRGDLDRSVEVHSNDEFSTLARAFNSMRQRIRENTDTILADRNKILAILGAMSEGVIAVDEREEVVHLNATAGEMFRIDPSDAIGRKLSEVIQLPELIRTISATLRDLEGRQGEIHLQRGMSNVLMELQSSGLRDRDGQAVGAVIVLRDITEIRRLEEMRSDFISNVSHELKTPLAAIKGLVESILEDEEMPDETRRRFLVRVERQANRLNSLVIDLLSLSRLERESAASLEIESIDARRAVLESIESQRLGAESKGLSLVHEIIDEPVRVAADWESVRQVVDNLLSNAIRYTPAGGTVTVRLAADAGEVHIEVQDTGMGIDPLHHERIFERFYRVDKARSRELGGTGLGLAIVKHIVRRLGGSIGVDSEVGKGSCFTIELPRVLDVLDVREVRDVPDAEVREAKPLSVTPTSDSPSTDSK